MAPLTSKELRIAQTMSMLNSTETGQLMLRALKAYERTLLNELSATEDNLDPSWAKQYDEWQGTRMLVAKLGGEPTP